jgi:hypothetical protein
VARYRWCFRRADTGYRRLSIHPVAVEGKDYRLDAQAGLLRLNPWTGTGTNWEAIPVAVTYAGGYGAHGSEHVVPATAPYQITIDAAGWACDIGVICPDGTPLTRASGLPGAGQYAVSNRVYTFAAADAGQSLALSFATAEVPDDLAATCLRLITARYKSRGRDPNLIQRETPG